MTTSRSSCSHCTKSGWSWFFAGALALAACGNASAGLNANRPTPSPSAVAVVTPELTPSPTPTANPSFSGSYRAQESRLTAPPSGWRSRSDNWSGDAGFFLGDGSTANNSTATFEASIQIGRPAPDGGACVYDPAGTPCDCIGQGNWSGSMPKGTVAWGSDRKHAEVHLALTINLTWSAQCKGIIDNLDIVRDFHDVPLVQGGTVRVTCGPSSTACSSPNYSDDASILMTSVNTGTP